MHIDVDNHWKFQTLSCLFAVFNAIVRLCMTDILPTVNRTLKLPKSKDPNKPVMPSSSKQWTRIRADVKTYITDIIQVFEDILYIIIPKQTYIGYVRHLDF